LLAGIMHGTPARPWTECTIEVAGAEKAIPPENNMSAMFRLMKFFLDAGFSEEAPRDAL
jgi:hypothetical protein